MRRVNEKMGGYQKLSWSKFKRGIEWVNGVKIQKVGGKFLFENGELEAEFEYSGDKLTRFNVVSSLVDDDWYQQPTNEKLYVDRAKRFLTAFVDGELQTAFDLMHPNLQKIVPPDKLQAMRDKVRADIESLKSVQHVRSSHTEDDLHRLTLYFDLQVKRPGDSEKMGQQIAEVSFDFAGLRGHLISFDMLADAEFPDEGHTAELSEFLTAVGRGDMDGAIQMIHPVLKPAIDPPVFQAWLESISDALGEFTELNDKQVALRTIYESGNEIVKVDGQAIFANGTASVTASAYEGLLIAFKVNTDLLADDWFQGVGDTTFYKERTEQFLRQWLAEDPAEAYALLHANLKQKMSLEEFADSVAGLKRQLGKLSSITIGNQVASTRKGVTIPAKVLFDSQKSATVRMEYLFDGLKGHLIQFDLSPDAE